MFSQFRSTKIGCFISLALLKTGKECPYMFVNTILTFVSKAKSTNTLKPRIAFFVGLSLFVVGF